MTIRAPRLRSRPAPRHSLRLGPDNWDGAPAYRPTVKPREPKKYVGKRRAGDERVKADLTPKKTAPSGRGGTPGATQRRRKPDANPRENLAKRPPSTARLSPRDNAPARVLPRNYPAKKANTREKDPTKTARRQLEGRADEAPIRPDPRSGELARSHVKARGTARRPDAKLPATQARHENPPAKRGVIQALFGGFFAGR